MIATLLQVAGAAAISGGVWFAVSPPVGVIVAGAAAVLFGVAVERADVEGADQGADE